MTPGANAVDPARAQRSELGGRRSSRTEIESRADDEAARIRVLRSLEQRHDRIATCRGRRIGRNRSLNVSGEPRGECQREAILPCEFAVTHIGVSYQTLRHMCRSELHQTAAPLQHCVGGAGSGVAGLPLVSPEAHTHLALLEWVRL